jgi:hypothetical protein
VAQFSSFVVLAQFRRRLVGIYRFQVTHELFFQFSRSSCKSIRYVVTVIGDLAGQIAHFIP